MKKVVSPRQRRAFTLVEVLVGLFLALTAVSMLTLMIPVATRGQVAAQEYLQIQDIAQAKLDRLKDLGYGRLNSTEIINGEIATSSQGGDVYTIALQKDVTAPVNATGTLRITDYNANVKRVSISFSWLSGGLSATTSNYQLDGLISRE